MRISLLTISLCCFSFAAIGQTTKHEFRCKVNTYTFELPDDFQTSHFNYVEGDYYSFYRIDSTAKTVTHLTLHCGSNVHLPHLSDSTFIVERTSETESSGTQLNGRYWRELNLQGGINIYYKNATSEERELLNEVIGKLLEQMD